MQTEAPADLEITALTRRSAGLDNCTSQHKLTPGMIGTRPFPTSSNPYKYDYLCRKRGQLYHHEQKGPTFLVIREAQLQAVIQNFVGDVNGEG
jgi:hypothetical protein